MTTTLTCGGLLYLACLLVCVGWMLRAPVNPDDRSTEMTEWLERISVGNKDLCNADLCNADLRGAELCDANFDGAKITYRGKTVRVRYEKVTR